MLADILEWPAADPRIARIAGAFVTQLSLGSIQCETSAFRVVQWERPDPFYRNVAVPVVVPSSWAQPVRELLELFRQLQRRPRLEFCPELWPGLREALADAGLVARDLSCLMVRERRVGPPLEPDPKVVIRVLGPDEPSRLLEVIFHEAARAFNVTEAFSAAAEIETMRTRLANGSVRSCIAAEADQILAGGSLLGGPDVAELAGVWTRRDWRRRGVGATVCAALLEPFFAGGGDLVWLAAKGSAGEALYTKLGFERLGTQIDMGLPGEP